MCFAKTKVPDVKPPVDREGDAAKAAYGRSRQRLASGFGENDTDVVGSVIANDNNPSTTVNTQLKKLMGG